MILLEGKDGAESTDLNLEKPLPDPMASPSQNGRTPSTLSSPPPYSAATSSASPLSSRPPPDLLPQNRFRVVRESGHYHGTVLIDPALPSRENYTENKEQFLVHTKFGEIKAKVYLIGDSYEKRVDLKAHAARGNIEFSLCHRPVRMPIRLETVSQWGSTTLRLPADFNGPLSVRLGFRCAVYFNGSMKRKAALVEEEDHVSRYWVGSQVGWVNDPDWRGDECVVECQRGHLYVEFWEPEPPKGRLEKRGGRKTKWFPL